MRVWDTKTGIPVRTFASSFSTVVFSVAFSPDGRHLAAVGFDDGVPACVLKVLDIQTGQCLCEHREGEEIFAVAYSPDGKWVAFGLGGGSVKIADSTSASEITCVGRHDRPIAYGGVQFRHDGLRLASASMDGTVRTWDLNSALTADDPQADHLLCQMSSGEPGVALWSVSYNPDGRRLITGNKVGELTMWDAENGTQLDKKSVASSGAYLSAAYSPNGSWIVSASEDCAVRVYDARVLELVHTFRGHLGPIRCLAVSDECLVSGGADKTVRVWDLKPVEKKHKARDQ